MSAIAIGLPNNAIELEVRTLAAKTGTGGVALLDPTGFEAGFVGTVPVVRPDAFGGGTFEQDASSLNEIVHEDRSQTGKGPALRFIPGTQPQPGQGGTPVLLLNIQAGESQSTVVEFTEDFVTWHVLGTVFGQGSVSIPTTNPVPRFFRIRP